MILSKLCEHIFSRMDSHPKWSHVKTKDRFIAMAIAALDSDASDELDSLAQSEAQSIKEEAAKIRELLAARGVNDLKYAYSEIMDEIDCSVRDDGEFGALMDKCASASGEVSAYDIVKAILDDPTPVVSACVLPTDKKPEEERQEGDAQSSQRLNWDDLIRAHKSVNGGIKMPEPGKKTEQAKGSGEKEREKQKQAQPDEDKNTSKNNVLADIVEKTRKVYGVLNDKVFGQARAVKTFVSGYFQGELAAVSGLNRRKPRATFLFAGSPGVGKTFLAEQAAEALGLDFCRFDMSEYVEKEASLEFAGSDKVYKNGKAGNVTSFVAEHPHCVLLFDEVEKAHLNVIHLFLQILDAGRLRDNFTDEEVSFSDAIIIFTTNAGKKLYEDESINISTVTSKTVIKALGADINPVTGSPLFPPAICSRFAAGNIVMFNRMGGDNLLKIAKREIDGETSAVSRSTGVEITSDSLLPYTLLYAVGGNADARTVKGRCSSFIYEEMFELLRLVGRNSVNAVNALKKVDISVRLPDDKKLLSLYRSEGRYKALVFADTKLASSVKKRLKSVDVLCADSVAKGKQLLEKNEISIVLCDIMCKARSEGSVLNIEDAASEGRDFFEYATGFSDLAVYVLSEGGIVSPEELVSLEASGAKGCVVVNGEGDLDGLVNQKCAMSHQQKNLLELSSANKVLLYKSLQRLSEDGTQALIELYDLELKTAVDAEDNGDVLDDVSKPNVRFDDVMGAKDAKAELAYFTQYLKNPKKYAARGVRLPKGILLYGPPGTGKTLLAKATAGESDVTFIKTEGNRFLKGRLGEGAEKIHEIFAKARKYAPSIVFIDEIDVIAKERGAIDSASDVLTALLTEMDGFNTATAKPVFVLAATNFNADPDAHVLDPALLRRFDRRIYIDLPDRENRLKYIMSKLKKLLGNTVTQNEAENIAARSMGASFADLESVFELAMRNLIKTEESGLNDAILEDAFETFISGEKKEWDQAQLLRTARHEAGHALVCRCCGEKPSYITVVARGDHGGYMQHANTENKAVYTKKELLSMVRTSLGGRAAEMVYYGDEDGLSTGPSADLRSATNILERMVTVYGMDELGLMSVDASSIRGTEYYGRIADRINALLKSELEYVQKLIRTNKTSIDKLVAALLEKNSLKEEEIEAILDNVKPI